MSTDNSTGHTKLACLVMSIAALVQSVIAFELMPGCVAFGAELGRSVNQFSGSPSGGGALIFVPFMMSIFVGMWSMSVMGASLAGVVTLWVLKKAYLAAGISVPRPPYLMNVSIVAVVMICAFLILPLPHSPIEHFARMAEESTLSLALTCVAYVLGASAILGQVLDSRRIV